MTLKKVKVEGIILTLSACAIVIIEAIRSNASYETAALAVNCLGFCMAPFVLFRYKMADFKRLSYLVWAILGAILIYPIYYFFSDCDVFASRFLFAELNVYLYGFIIIRQFIQFFIEKHRPRSRGMSVFYYVWAIMMVLCVLSVNISVWPLYFTVIFSAYYIAPLKREDVNTIFRSFVDGIIIAFIILQGAACLHRPYLVIRYGGIFYNPNYNAFLYLLTYVALLAKMHILRADLASKIIKGIFFLLASSMWVLVSYTGTRAALMGFIGVTFVYLLLEMAVYNKRALKTYFLLTPAMFIIAFLLRYPVYLVIRYVPQLRHHPIYYFDEYDALVNSSGLSVITSEELKNYNLYIPYWQATGLMSYRMQRGENSVINEPVEDEATNTEEIIADYESNSEKTTYEADSNADAVYKEIKYDKLYSLLGIRKYMWMYYFSQTNFIGHEISEEHVQLTPDFLCGHPHNSFLFMSYSYGAIPGLLFLFMIFGVPVYLIIESIKEKDISNWPAMFTSLIFIAFISYGLFETMFPGRALLSFVFMTQLLLVKRRIMSL